jgi:hypothetical protein
MSGKCDRAPKLSARVGTSGANLQKSWPSSNYSLLASSDMMTRESMTVHVSESSEMLVSKTFMD